MDRMDAVTGLGCILILALLTVSGIIGSICWPYTIESWAVYLNPASTVDIKWYQGFLMGYVPWLGQLSLPGAVVTWVCMLILI